MKINEDTFAIVRPDGEVAGDGECLCLHGSQEAAEDALKGEFGDFLREINRTDDLSIVRVRLVRVED